MKRALIAITSMLGGTAYALWLIAVATTDKMTTPDKLVLIGLLLAIPAIILGGIAWHLSDLEKESE